MARKGGSRPSRKGGKTGRKSGGPDSSATGTSLVPMSTLTVLTDKMRLPVKTEQTLRTTLSYQVAGWIVSNAAAPGVASIAVSLGQLAGGDLTSLQTVFDQYKIEAVEFWINPQANVNLPTAGSGAPVYANQPRLVTVIDLDNAASVGSIAQASNYSSAVTTEPYEKQRRCFKPHIAYAAYGSGAFTSYANQQAGWVDIASSGVSHFGLKAACDMDGNTSGPHAEWDLTVRASVLFRNVQ